MKRYLGLAIVLFVRFSAAVFAQEPGDAVAVDPDTHHVILEHPHVRICEAHVSHCNRMPTHSYPPTVLVTPDWARLKLTLPDGTSNVHDFSPGQVLCLVEGGTCFWEILAANGRVTTIEAKSVQEAMK